jgi:hypothetical protein
LAIFYPFVGLGNFQCDTVETWCGSPLTLVPVRLMQNESLAGLIPQLGLTFDDRKLTPGVGEIK